MPTIHDKSLLGTLKTEYELAVWNTDDNKQYRAPVSQVLEKDALQTITNGNVVSRGNGNSAAGSYNLIIGNGNVQSGAGETYSLMVGDGNTLEASSAMVVGSSNSVLADCSAAIGELNQILETAVNGIALGYGNKISGSMQMACGQGASATRFGELTLASKKIAEVGDNQMSFLHAQLVTDGTNAAQELLLAGDLIGIITNTSVAFEAHLHGVLHSGSPGTAGDSCYKVVRGIIKNVGGTVSLTGSVITTAIANDTEADWTWGVVYDDTDKKLKISITPQTGQVVRAAAHIILSQIGFDTYTG